MRRTIEAYDRHAAAYAARTVAVPDSVRSDLEHLATRLGSGARVMHAEERPAFLAKNRYGLPDTLPLSWSEFLAAMPQSA